jgi:hypothetical protein
VGVYVIFLCIQMLIASFKQILKVPLKGLYVNMVRNKLFHTGNQCCRLG